MSITLIEQGAYTKSWIGLSTDTMPQQASQENMNGANNGDKFTQLDTAKTYMYMDGSWYDVATGSVKS